MSELQDRLAALAGEPARPVDLAAVERRARHLRRRSRVAGGTAAATVAVVAVVAGLLLLPGSHPQRREVTTIAPSIPTGPGGRAAKAKPVGALALSNLVFEGGGRGLVTLAGSSSPTGKTTIAWADTTSDGGLRWTPSRPVSGTGRIPQAGNLTFVSPTQGWALGTDTVADPLLVTTDGGATWSSQLPGQVASDIATSGHSAWVVANGTCSTCRSLIYTTSTPGAPLRLLPAQPPGQGVSSLVRPTSTTAVALISVKGDNHLALVATDDNGQHWSPRPLPCSIPAHQPGGAGVLASAGPRSLLVTCAGAPTSMDVSEAPQTIYRSSDLGQTWQQVTPVYASVGQAVTAGLGDEIANLEPVGHNTMWILETDSEAGNGPVLRSTDGGRTWRTVLERTVPDTETPLDISSLTATSPTTAWITATIAASSNATEDRPVLLHTTNGGTTWTTTTLPIPAGGRPT